MNPAEIQSFDSNAQGDMEESFPAIIQFLAGTPTIGGTPIVCAGGDIHQVDMRGVPGGLLDDYELYFRVRYANIASVPNLGAQFQWKRQGEVSWRPQISTVMRISDPMQAIAFELFGGNPAK